MKRYVRSILLGFMVIFSSLSGYANSDFTPLERIPLVGNGDNGIVAWEKGHEMSLLNPLAAQLGLTPFKAFYNLASRDVIDGTAPNGHEIYGMTGDSNRSIDGFRNFSALLNNNIPSLSNFTIRFETVTLGTDTSGVEWEENATSNEEWRIYSGDANTKANIYLDAHKIVSCQLSALHLTLQHHTILDTTDDAVSGYSEPCFPINATDVNTPQIYKDVAEAFLADVSDNAIRFNFASIQTIPTSGNTGYYIVENAFVELNATSSLVNGIVNHAVPAALVDRQFYFLNEDGLIGTRVFGSNGRVSGEINGVSYSDPFTVDENISIHATHSDGSTVDFTFLDDFANSSLNVTLIVTASNGAIPVVKNSVLFDTLEARTAFITALQANAIVLEEDIDSSNDYSVGDKISYAIGVEIDVSYAADITNYEVKDPITGAVKSFGVGASVNVTPNGAYDYAGNSVNIIGTATYSNGYTITLGAGTDIVREDVVSLKGTTTLRGHFKLDVDFPFIKLPAQDSLVNLNGNFMYLANEDSSSVYKIDSYGNYSILIEDMHGVSGMAVRSNGTLYMSDDDNRITSLTEDGVFTELNIDQSILSNPNALAIDGDQLYIANAGSSIVRMNLNDFNDTQVLATGLSIPESVQVVGNYLYFTDDYQALYRVEKNATTTQTDPANIRVADLSAEMGHTDGGLTYYNGNFYVSDYGNNRILQVDATNYDVSVLYSTVNAKPRGLTVHDNVLFATLFSLDQVVAINLDDNSSSIFSDFSGGVHEGAFGIVITPNEYNSISNRFSLGMLNGLRLYEVSPNGSNITQYDFNATHLMTQVLNNTFSDNYLYSVTAEGYLDLNFGDSGNFYYRIDDQNDSGLLMSSTFDAYNESWSHQEFYFYNFDDANRTMMLRQPVIITADNIIGSWNISEGATNLGCTDIKPDGTETFYMPNGTVDNHTWLFSNGNMEVTADNGTYLHSIKFSEDANVTGNMYHIEAIRVAFVFGNGGAQYRTFSSVASCDNNTSVPNDFIQKDVNFTVGWNLFSFPGDIQIQANSMPNHFNVNTLYWGYNQGQWSSYSANTGLAQQIMENNISMISSFVANKGYWARSNMNINATLQGAKPQAIDYSNLEDGWHLLGSQQIENVADFMSQHSNINIVWIYRYGQWFGYSQNNTANETIQNQYQLLSIVDDTDGVWVYIQN